MQRAMKRIFGLLPLLATLLCGAAQAKVVLPALFADHMVLQQQAEVKLWGRAAGRVTVSASWTEETYSAEASGGVWSVMLPTPAGSCRPQTLTVRDADSEVVLRDVLVGEVWICSGQSNMEMTLRGYARQPVAGALRTALEAPHYRDRIRMLRVERKEADRPRTGMRGRWEVPSAQTALATSAVAWHFARALADAIAVPVGIITASRSSSKIEAWMPQELLAEKFGYDVETINADPAIRGISKCGLYFNGMLAPLVGFPARGFLWYQGESNRDNPETYARLLEAMAAEWRARWGDAKQEMPFIYVQIAPYAYDERPDGFDAPRVVEAQLRALDRIPQAAMVATTDLGQSDCIHPADKRTVGERAAVEALRMVYAQDIPDASGMRPSGVEFAGRKAVVTFDNAQYGLLPCAEPVTGFEVAGEEGIFHPAEARIVANRPAVEVASPEVPRPTAVRYAYRNYAPGNLRNTLGYPAFPFRTDSLPLTKCTGR